MGLHTKYDTICGDFKTHTPKPQESQGFFTNHPQASGGAFLTPFRDSGFYPNY